MGVRVPTSLRSASGVLERLMEVIVAPLIGDALPVALIGVAGLANLSVMTDLRGLTFGPNDVVVVVTPRTLR